MSTENNKITKKHMPIVLRRFRDNAELSQQALADKIGISKGFYAKLENGLKAPNVDMVFRIALALGIEPEELIKALKDEWRKF